MASSASDFASDKKISEPISASEEQIPEPKTLIGTYKKITFNLERQQIVAVQPREHLLNQTSEQTQKQINERQKNASENAPRHMPPAQSAPFALTPRAALVCTKCINCTPYTIGTICAICIICAL
jgi:hypothetical protein